VLDGAVILEWPGPGKYGASVPAALTAVYDALTGEQILTILRFGLYADAAGTVWIQAEAFCTRDGKLITGRAIDPVTVGDGPELLTAVFSFSVTEMRIRGGGA